jgi:DNA-binding response OmpR family regulator
MDLQIGFPERTSRCYSEERSNWEHSDMKILIVEDNELLGSSLKQGLEECGWIVDLARDGEEGLFYAQNGLYSILLIDRMLPKISGDRLVERLKSIGYTAPVIMVTARGTLEERVGALESTVDDYVVKPFELTELIARIKAVHRRTVGADSKQLVLGSITVDLNGRSVQISGRGFVSLTTKEHDLLIVLAGRKGQLLSRCDLASYLYEMNEEPESNSLDVLIARLRRKIAGTGVEITTVRGKGFRLNVESPAP